MLNYQFVGIDVAKDKFDAALCTGDSYQANCFTNNLSGYKAFIKWLKNKASAWVCMEATGHYSELIADYLVKQNIRVSIINPLQIKSFARSKLTRNKTDQLDAKIIAEYAAKMQPRTYMPRNQTQKSLRDFTNLLDTLKAQHTQLSNQLHSAMSEEAKKRIRKLLKELEKEIARLEKHIAQLIQENRALTMNLSLITSIKGIGNLTAYKVLAHIPDITCFATAKQFSAFIGLTPKQHQSGLSRGKTTISRLGDSRLRKSFYMAALVAKRFNPLLQDFVKRLQEKGKAPKAIVCAVMRKLAHFVFGVLKNNKPFNPDFA